MSKFSRLKKVLGFWEASRLYMQMRRKKYREVKMNGIRHLFTLRKNPYDYHTFEEVLLRKSYTLPAGINPKTIIDGGGNIGLTAIFFANQFPDARIITIEPDSENFKLLETNCRPYQNITPVKSAVWSHAADLRVIDKGQGNNAFTVQEADGPATDTIKAHSIEELGRKEGWAAYDVVKLDIEGSEKQVFQTNYESWLPKTKVLFVELHDRMVEGCSRSVFAAISKYDFHCEIVGENLLFINKAL